MSELPPEQERMILDEIERRLRRQDPRLDRRMRRRGSEVRALFWRPGVLVTVAGFLAAGGSGSLVWAVAGGRTALLPGVCAAAVAALGTVGAFRRLSVIQEARTGTPRTRD